MMIYLSASQSAMIIRTFYLFVDVQAQCFSTFLTLRTTKITYEDIIVFQDNIHESIIYIISVFYFKILGKFCWDVVGITFLFVPPSKII